MSMSAPLPRRQCTTRWHASDGGATEYSPRAGPAGQSAPCRREPRRSGRAGSAPGVAGLGGRGTVRRTSDDVTAGAPRRRGHSAAQRSLPARRARWPGGGVTYSGFPLPVRGGPLALQAPLSARALGTTVSTVDLSSRRRPRRGAGGSRADGRPRRQAPAPGDRLSARTVGRRPRTTPASSPGPPAPRSRPRRDARGSGAAGAVRDRPGPPAARLPWADGRRVSRPARPARWDSSAGGRRCPGCRTRAGSWASTPPAVSSRRGTARHGGPGSAR